MKDLGRSLQDFLGKQLGLEGYEVDLVPIPSRGDRMIRLRTLEEAIEEFDSETQGYLVQIRPRPATAGSGATAAGKPVPAMAGIPADLAGASKPSLDGIYLPTGKINVPYLIQNAELLFACGEFALARKIYKTILASGERTSLALYWMGRCLEAEGKSEAAQKHYEESIAYQPTLQAYESYASLLIRCQKDLEAAEVLERALHMKDLPAASRFELHKACGNCWMRADRKEPAEKHYNKALEIDPYADDIQANLGSLYLQEGQLGPAKQRFQDALVSNPRNDKALAGMGSCFLAEGDKRKAHDSFAQALDIDLNNPTAIYYLVKCAYELKSYATAARIVEDYAESAPVNASLLYSLAGLQFHLGRLQESRATCGRILEMQPGHPGACELLRLIDKYSVSH